MTAPEASGKRGRGRAVAVLVLLLVALAGVFAGVVLERTVLGARHEARAGRTGRPMMRDMPRREAAFRERFAREVELTDAQRVTVDSLMDAQLQALREVRRETQPEIESIVRRTRRSIDAVLTPEQRRRAAELAERRFGPRGARPHGDHEPSPR